MYWQFHYPKRFSFYPPDYESPGLGGAETAIVLLTRGLSAAGHAVDVFNCCFRPGTYDGVRWRSTWELETAEAADVAVAVRFEEALWPASIRAPHRLFWMLDERTSGPAAFAATFANSRGTVVTPSHEATACLRRDAVPVRSLSIPLPVEVARYRHDIPRERACLFASMPDRGLDVALAIWPRIRREVPDAELWITGGWRLWGYSKAEAQDLWDEVVERVPLPEAVKVFGPIPRDELCKLQQRASVVLYPSRVREMFCLVAAEAAAAGTPMVASALGALVERVHDGRTGTLIHGDIEREDVQRRFVEATVQLLQDRDRRDRYGAECVSHARRYAIERVARAWTSLVSD